MAAENDDISKNSTGNGNTAGDAVSSSAGTYATHNVARPLSLLAERLGELEQSLTVVASEIGVSGTPQFKHLDTQKVYAEAANHARQAVQQAQSDLMGRMQQADAASVAMGLRLASELAALAGRIDDLDIRVAALLQQLEATRRQTEHQSKLAPAIATLRERLDRLGSMAPAAPDPAPIDALRQRLEALERQQLSAAKAAPPAEWPFADDGSPVHKPAAGETRIDSFALQRDIEEALQNRLNQTMRELEARLLQKLEERLDAHSQAATAAPGAAIFDQPASLTAGDIEGLREMIAQELATLLPQNAPSSGPVPILSEQGDINPLLMTAAERAIVRLTHRIEKLESRNEPGGGDRSRATLRSSSRSSRKFMARLFES